MALRAPPSPNIPPLPGEPVGVRKDESSKLAVGGRVGSGDVSKWMDFVVVAVGEVADVCECTAEEAVSSCAFDTTVIEREDETNCEECESKQ